MANVAGTVAALRFKGDDLDPDRLTALLGKQPSKSRRKGDLMPSKRIRSRVGFWSVTAQDREPGDLDAQVKELLAGMTESPAVWAELAKYRPDILVGLFMNESNEGIELSAKTMSLLASRGIKIGLDIYAPIEGNDVEIGP